MIGLWPIFLLKLRIFDLIEGKKGSPIKGFVKRKNTPSFKKIYFFLIDS